jgi:type II secretory pathway predicted ATPase ExeA
MLVLKKTLNELGLLQTNLAIACDMSNATIAQLLNHGLWPKTEEKAKELREKIMNFLKQYNADNDSVFDVIEAEPMKHLQAMPKALTTKDIKKQSEEDDHMLLRKQSLTPKAKQQFGLMRDPFTDLRSADDMWVSPDIRYVRECIAHTAKHGGFTAVIGESGSGKSSIAIDLEQRIEDEGLPIILVKPYVLAAEETETKGTVLKSAHIAEAILRKLTPNAPMRISPMARFTQVHNALINSHKSGYSICILLEEAHSMPTTTLRHFKRLLELRIGFTPLVSAVLIGQPELKIKLDERNAEVREIVQRCEVITLNPMRPELVEDFLRHRFARAGAKVENVIDQTGINRIAERLVSRAGESQLYPLAIGNFVLAAMNIAANIGVPVIDASIIDEVM